MKKLFWILLLAAAALAANTLGTVCAPANAHPQPPTEYEFYWDDGIISSGWMWYTGGNYWAVQFTDAKTGDNPGWVTRYGACTYPNWPDSTSQGFYMHTFDDLGGYPGSDLGYELLIYDGGVYGWVDADPPVYVSTSVFYIAAQQIGNYPSCDAICVSMPAGTHNWTGYQGSWSPSTSFGNFMIRCYWDDEDPSPAVEEITWGQVKALY